MNKQNIIDKHDDCKGCNVFYGCSHASVFTYENKEYRCPCMLCLVKIICQDDGICHDYLEYYDIITGYRTTLVTEQQISQDICDMIL